MTPWRHSLCLSDQEESLQRTILRLTELHMSTDGMESMSIGIWKIERSNILGNQLMRDHLTGMTSGQNSLTESLGIGSGGF